MDNNQDALKKLKAVRNYSIGFGIISMGITSVTLSTAFDPKAKFVFIGSFVTLATINFIEAAKTQKEIKLVKDSNKYESIKIEEPKEEVKEKPKINIKEKDKNKEFKLNMFK